MASDIPSNVLTLSDFFAAAERRSDCWAKLSVVGRAWAAAATRGQPTEALAAEAAQLMAEIEPLEEFWAYPGLRLMNLLREQLASGDAGPFARLVAEIGAGPS